MKTIIILGLGAGMMLAGITGCKKQSDGHAETGQANQFTQSYKIESKAFIAKLRRITPPQPGESNQALLLRCFIENNVVMDPPSAVLIDEIGNRVLVRATESERQKIQALIERIEKG